MNKLYGITHSREGNPIVRAPRLLKIGIGVPRGPAVHCWIQWSQDGTKLEWVYRYGVAKEGNKLEWVVAKRKIDLLDKDGNSNRVAAEAFYREIVTKSPQSKYPQKLPYFTFTKPVLVDKTEVFEPDFEAIEKHGPTPTSIDIVLMDDEPLSAEYAMWSASELKCHGDGIDALRILAMATEDDRDAVALAKAKGEKYFSLKNGCAVCGCQFYKEADGKPAPCKASADLKFHLINDIRIGGTAYFHTSGFRSITYLFSGLEELRVLTRGRLRGIPVRMSLKSYKTKHNGQVATQYGVWIEFKADNIAALKRNLIQAAMEFSGQLTEAPRQLEAGSTNGASDDGEEVVTHTAKAMASEFYPEAIDEDVETDNGSSATAGTAEEDTDQTGGEDAAGNAAAATEAKTETLKEELKQQATGETAPTGGTAPTPAPEPGAQQSSTDELRERLKAQQSKPIVAPTSAPANASPAPPPAKKKELF